ncbi:hypothetical protein H696_00070 [Fonticula alba]|uniref:Uncharacterized protein n=1 Tax=Fonticula alba TaxID=691883 RepID=A0A058ZDP2_FONAL|nr:hypothetical protein H696_00070 [Fonticula alba]KCV72474.1 hypothetical protein H696_00070 [Fonticula alba]|eukprot:XP_009492175.1 hypothetical protein H696_00070 [Fonticula alba]
MASPHVRQASALFERLRRFAAINRQEVQDWTIFVPGKYRFPAPGSQGAINHATGTPNGYKILPDRPSARISDNYYFKRDLRRELAQTPPVVFTSSSLLEGAAATAAIEGGAATNASTAAASGATAAASAAPVSKMPPNCGVYYSA